MSRTRSIKARLKPHTEKLLRDLCAIFEERVEAMAKQVEVAFEHALSAAATELAAPRPTVTVDIAGSVEPLRITDDELKQLKAVAPAPDGKKTVTCKKCGYVGGNARGCGKSHPTLLRVLRQPHTVATTEAAESPRVERIKRVSIARSGQPPTLGMRTRRPVVEPAPEPEPEEDDDSDDSDERWSKLRIKDETRIAEGKKHEGLLPMPRSSFRTIPRPGDEDLADVEELNFGDRD